MSQRVGVVTALYRYPVKSMAGEPLASAELGPHGLEGDRRFALRREGETGGSFPWLTASKLARLILYVPRRPADGAGPAAPPTHVRTPGGEELELEGEPLRRELSAAFGGGVRVLRVDQGVFDEAPVSLITTGTIASLAARTGRALDIRRFRPNILLETPAGAPDFPEDAWVGRVLAFGDGGDGATTVHVTHRDVRCVMVNLDPDTAAAAPEVLKGAVQANENCAGVYGSALRTGRIAVGDGVYLVEGDPP